MDDTNKEKLNKFKLFSYRADFVFRIFSAVQLNGMEISRVTSVKKGTTYRYLKNPELVFNAKVGTLNQFYLYCKSLTPRFIETHKKENRK